MRFEEAQRIKEILLDGEDENSPLNGIELDVRRVQRGLQLFKLPGTIGILGPDDWHTVPGATWPRDEPLTCNWDSATERRLRNAFTAGEAFRKEHEVLASSFGVPVLEIASMRPSADGRKVTIDPDTAAQWMRNTLDDQIDEYGIGGPCAIAQGPQANPTPQTAQAVQQPHVEGDTIDSIRLYVPRLASGLFAWFMSQSEDIVFSEEDFSRVRWDSNVAQQFIEVAMAELGFAPAVSGNVGSDLIYAHMRDKTTGRVATTHEEAERIWKPMQDAISASRNEWGLSAPRDPYANAPRAWRAEVVAGPPVLVEPVEASVTPDGESSSVGPIIAVGAAAFVGWMFWRLVKR